MIAWTAVLLSLGAQAAYPEKPIRFVIPSAAGGSPDVLMRILVQQLSQQMNVPIVVENKPGASFVELIKYAKQIRGGSPWARAATAPPATSAASSSRR